MVEEKLHYLGGFTGGAKLPFLSFCAVSINQPSLLWMWALGLERSDQCPHGNLGTGCQARPEVPGSSPGLGVGLCAWSFLPTPPRGRGRRPSAHPPFPGPQRLIKALQLWQPAGSPIGRGAGQNDADCQPPHRVV